MPRLALVLGVLLASSTQAYAEEWQLKPFLGVTFGSNTTFVDLAEGTERKHTAVGTGVVLLGDIVGVEADFGYMPGFFQGSGNNLVVRSSALSLTGNVMLTLPRRVTEYTLRPYLVGGFGLLRASTEDLVGALSITENLPAFDVGAGVTGFLTQRVGVSWDVRYFRSIGGPETTGATSVGMPRLSFWRANMALAIRY